MVGGEAGLQSYLVKDISGPSGTANFDMNFGGAYAVLKAGFGF
jgi:hypothetical protein